MPSFRRRASVIDDDSASASSKDPDRAVDPAQARALAEEAEAEAAEAEALAAAAAAKARAARLRRQAEVAAKEAEAADDAAGVAAADAEVRAEAEVEPEATVATEAAREADEPVEPAGATDVGEDIDAAEEHSVAEDGKRAPRIRLRLPRPTWKGVGLSAAVLCTCALLAASGYLIWLHQQVDLQAKRNAEYSAAARQGVVTLMSLDFNKAKEDVQRILDNSTGEFKADFQKQADSFAKVAQESKVTTEVKVNSTAVKSMSDNTANVLVSATSLISNSAGAKQDPRSWRLSVDLARDGDQIKLARVEFVP